MLPLRADTHAPPPNTPIVATASAERHDEVSTATTIAQVWARLEPFLPTPVRGRRPLVHDRRMILEAIVYVMQTDCGWCNIPSRYPPWKTVHEQFVIWRNTGVWDQIWHGLTPPGPRPLEELQL